MYTFYICVYQEREMYTYDVFSLSIYINIYEKYLHIGFPGGFPHIPSNRLHVIGFVYIYMYIY